MKRDIVHMLTERERQIVALVAEGLRNKKIAEALSISENTVATHLKRLFLKVGVGSRAAMVHRCARLIE